MSRGPKPDPGPRAADLIEEAVHLLRRHPRELGVYYAATGPFAVALLYFWSYVTWFAPADGELAAGALLLALLFGAMKAGQNHFAARLLALRLGETPPPWRARPALREVGAQLRLQAGGVVLVPLAMLFTVPFGWVYGYYQNATVLPPGRDGDPVTRQALAWQQIQLWPAQNHWALAILSGLWLMVAVNVATTFYLVPTLATQWLGLKTVFALNGWAYANTTFLVLVVVLTHLLVDPLIKAFYVLRVFHGRARRTGADLRLVLAREKSLRRRLAPGAALLVLGAILFCVLPLRAAEPATAVMPPPQSAPVHLLNPALDQVLDQPDFRWRLRPLPVAPDLRHEGIIKGFVRSTFAILQQIGRSIYRGIEAVRRWIGDLLPGGKGSEADPAAGAGKQGNPLDWMFILELAAYILLIGVAGLLVFVAWKVIQHNRVALPVATTAPEAAGTPDLRDEQVEASRLPADGWLELARQQLAAGEWRLALRALFLATLARHAHAGLLSLAKFKTNFDYELELRRRAHSRMALVEEFHGRRRQFEDVWYGSAPASDAQVREWLRQLEAAT